MTSAVPPVPKVSVCVVTYNQVGYIAQCLESLVTQRTDFPFEVVVFDDCSSDGTSDVVAQFASHHPERVIHVRHEHNLGALANFEFAHANVSGQYIAHMDGDDYALPGKLQAQADFLDRHPDCQIVWHRMMILDVNTGAIGPQYFDADRILSAQYRVDDIVSNITIGLHSSKMYRRWDRAYKSPLAPLDFSENVLHLHATGGYAAFVGEQALGVYRINVGISKGRARIRSLIYDWLAYFYRQRMADRRLLFAKVLLMVMSDAKHRGGSLRAGLGVLMRMPGGALPLRVGQVRTRMVPTSVAVVSAHA